MKGYNGKILRVDLTNKQISVEEPSEEYYRRYLGGTGVYHRKTVDRDARRGRSSGA